MNTSKTYKIYIENVNVAYFCFQYELLFLRRNSSNKDKSSPAGGNTNWCGSYSDKKQVIEWSEFIVIAKNTLKFQSPYNECGRYYNEPVCIDRTDCFYEGEIIKATLYCPAENGSCPHQANACAVGDCIFDNTQQPRSSDHSPRRSSIGKGTR